MKLLHASMALMVAAILLAGCGEGGEAAADKALECPRTGAGPGGDPPPGEREAWISLNGYVGPASIGILMAEERGYFADAGLAVTVTGAAAPDAPLEYVQGHLVDFGVSQLPEIVMAREEEAAVIAVGTLVSRPTTAMIWLEKSRIEGVADLEGKTIAFPGIPFQKAFLQSLLEEAGLTLEDVEVKQVGYKLVQALVSGRADAVFGGTPNLDGAALEARGLEPVVVPVRDLGVPAYEDLVVVTRSDHMSQDPRLIHDFMSAVVRGNAAAAEDPEGAVELIEKGAETDPAAGRKTTKAGVDATLPLLTRTGCMNLERASELVDWMNEQGLIQEEPSVSELLTNRFVGRP
jgi:putative hydroxymethylpyrimidine transport system substrate-binding protein